MKDIDRGLINLFDEVLSSGDDSLYDFEDLAELVKMAEDLIEENEALRKQVNVVARRALAEIGTEFEEDKRIAKKSMPFVRAIVLNKIQDFPLPPKD